MVERSHFDGVTFIAPPPAIAFSWAQRCSGAGTKGHQRVDWSKAPTHAHWWAVDANGAAHWFADPRLTAFDTSWRFEVMAAPDFGYIGDYKQSLTERPSRAL
ncbi:MAG: hypothetical protein LBE61_10045 [Burkholderiaceae bacterium]|jgi:hypothetical protein|nr:hypothetical protein [Burkholderiaceae bacterium]